MYNLISAAIVSSAFIVSSTGITKPFIQTGSFLNSIDICGEILYTASSDGEVRGISLKGGRIVRKFVFEKFETPMGMVRPSAYFAECGQNGEWVIASSSSGKLVLLNKKFEPSATYVIPETHAYSAEIIGNDLILLSTINGIVRALKIPSLEPLWKVKANWDAIKTLTASPDGRFFATGSNDSRIHIRNTGDGKIEKTLIGHKDAVYTISWSPDGKHLLTGSKDRRLLYWNLDSGAYIELHSDFTYIYAAIIINETLAAATTNENEISIFSLADLTRISTFKGHSSIVGTYAYSKGYLYSGSTGGSIYRWDMRKLLKGN